MNNCETCIHNNVCRFKDDFMTISTKASNDVYGNIFDVSCNEYMMTVKFREYIEENKPSGGAKIVKNYDSTTPPPRPPKQPTRQLSYANGEF